MENHTSDVLFFFSLWIQLYCLPVGASWCWPLVQGQHSTTRDHDPRTMDIRHHSSNKLFAQTLWQNIFLMAHSGGSVIGIQAAARVPELYAAYIGVGQISHQLQSEVLSYDRELGNQPMVQQLEAAPVTMTTVPLPAPYMRVRDKAMHSLGVGTTRDMRSVISGIFLASFFVGTTRSAKSLRYGEASFSGQDVVGQDDHHGSDKDHPRG